MEVVTSEDECKYSHYEELKSDYHWRSPLSTPYLQKKILRKIKNPRCIYRLFSKLLSEILLSINGSEGSSSVQTREQLPIKIPKDKVAAFCRRNHIRKLSLFGSVLREDFTLESDIDFLVEFLSGAEITYFDLAQMERELSQMLDGRQVDLRTTAELSPYFRQEVLETAVVQYVED